VELEFSWLQILLIALIFFISAVVQGSVGFAAGMIGVPLFLLFRIGMTEAVAFALVSSVVANFSGAWQLRRDFVWQEAWLPMLLRLVAQPLGVITLVWAAQYQDFASQLVGIVLLALLAVQQLWKVEPRDSLHPIWTWIAMPLSGYFFGLCSMGGPPLVMWVAAHRWSPAKMRAFMFFVFGSGLIPQGIWLCVNGGQRAVDAILLGSLAVPILLLGAQLGLFIGHRLPEHRLRFLTFWLLVLLGVSAIVMPLLSSPTR
jgi:uncharacterized membrane protein YfcA